MASQRDLLDSFCWGLFFHVPLLHNGDSKTCLRLEKIQVQFRHGHSHRILLNRADGILSLLLQILPNGIPPLYNLELEEPEFCYLDVILITTVYILNTHRN